MALYEYAISIHTLQEEPLIYFINDQMGIDTYSVEADKNGNLVLKIYMAQELSDWQDKLAAFLEQTAIEMGVKDYHFAISSRKIEDDDWLNNWKQYFKPIEIENKICVRPPWEANNSGLLDLQLNPKMGFGTGQHPTTFLCLKALCHEQLSGKTLLDVGAGSGILGTASLLFGAGYCDLVENDPVAIESCEETLLSNGVANKAAVLCADIFSPDLSLLQKKYDLALINIIAEVIVKILELGWIRKIPTLYLSGIIAEKRDLILDAINQAGYRIILEENLDNWLFFKIQKATL